jgi:hypothetical protein
MADAHRQVKTALDETRLLILGAEILFGFHLNAVFQKGFAELPETFRWIYAAAFLSMAITVGLLIAPSMQHRIVEHGNTSGRILRVTTRFAGAALLPFALSLGADLAIVVSYRFGMALGIATGLVLSATALFFWYGIERWIKAPSREKQHMEKETNTSIDVRVEHMLTEARVLLPGAQAVFGFQLAVLLTEGFAELPQASRVIHAAALCCIALSIILLMTPAAIHRISFDGQNTDRFHRLGSRFVVVSALPLALGIVGDLYVAVTKALETPAIGCAVALVAGLILATLWFVQPLVLRLKHR